MNPILLGIILWAIAVTFHFGLSAAISLAQDFEDKNTDCEKYSNIRVRLVIYYALVKTI